MHLRAQMTTNIRNKVVPPLCTPATMYGYGPDGYDTDLNPLGINQKSFGIDSLLIQLMIKRDPDILNVCPQEISQKYFTNLPEIPMSHANISAGNKIIKPNLGMKLPKNWPRKPHNKTKGSIHKKK